jgi:hypothetical protein
MLGYGTDSAAGRGGGVKVLIIQKEVFLEGGGKGDSRKESES